MQARVSLKRNRMDLSHVAGMRPPPASKLSAAGMRYKQVARQPVTTVQMQILLAANVDPDECAKRKNAAALATELLSPLRTNRKDYAQLPGQFVMCHYDPHGGLGRTHMSNDTCLVATNTPAGLPVNARLFFPGLSTIPTHPGNSQQTIRVHGVDSFCNTGNRELLPGDQMLLDPVASMVTMGPDKELVSAIEPPEGVSKDFIPFSVRGMNPLRQQQEEQEILALSQRRMATQDFQRTYTSASVQGKHPELRKLIKTHCTDLVKSNFYYADDDPRRGFLELHSARFLCTLVMTSGEASIQQNGVAAKRCLIVVMQDLQRAYEDEAMQWRNRFPSYIQTAADPYNLEAQCLKIEGERFKTFLTTLPTKWEEMAFIDAAINHAFDFYSRLQSWRIQDYFKRYIVGSCLTHTMPGKLGDMIIGDKR
jgi:hypothetical protein